MRSGLALRPGARRGNPDEQKRVVADQLTRWATRDGGDGTQIADAIRTVLDQYIPGR